MITTRRAFFRSLVPACAALPLIIANPTTKAIAASANISACQCGWALYFERDESKEWVECKNPECVGFGVKFQIPRLELAELNR